MSYFQKDYATARDHFLAAAEARGFRQLRLRAPAEESSELYVDFSMLKRNPKKLLLHISGLHGIEAYTGSAIQTKILKESLDAKLLAQGDHSILFIHGLNAFGMAFYRRTNANNVDLNRNFLKDKTKINPDYEKFHPFLSPSTPRAKYTSYFGFLFQLLGHGKERALQAIASGQNTHPDGLFYAGTSLQREILHVVEFLRQHFPLTEEAYVLDVHTGLGKRGKEFLFGDSDAASFATSCFQRSLDFPAAKTESYQSAGMFSEALRAALPKTNWHYFLQEFGTIGNFAVLRALREENFAWKNRFKDPRALTKAGDKLYLAFNPSDPTWQEASLALGLKRFMQLNQSLAASV